jgi:hypothetical protein
MRQSWPTRLRTKRSPLRCDTNMSACKNVLCVALMFGQTVVAAQDKTLLGAAPPGADCGRSETRGVTVSGRVHDTMSRLPIRGATVEVSFARPLSTGLQVRAVESGVGGSFVFCNLPTDITSLFLRAVSDGVSSGQVPVALANESKDSVLLYVGAAHHRTIAGDSNRVASGNFAITGVVRFPSGSPVAGATVQVLGSDATAITSDSGTFVLRGAPGGSQVVEVRRIGLEPTWLVRNIGVARSTFAVEIADSPVVLPGVSVTANADMAGFEARRRGAIRGHFMGVEELARRDRNTSLSALLQDVQGVRRVCGPRGCTLLMERMASAMTGTGKEFCQPFLYVNGMRDRTSEDGDFDFLHADDIASIEVYSREAHVPAEFIALAVQKPCGVIVVWRKR